MNKIFPTVFKAACRFGIVLAAVALVYSSQGCQAKPTPAETAKVVDQFKGGPHGNVNDADDLKKEMDNAAAYRASHPVPAGWPKQ